MARTTSPLFLRLAVASALALAVVTALWRAGIVPTGPQTPARSVAAGQAAGGHGARPQAAARPDIAQVGARAVTAQDAAPQAPAAPVPAPSAQVGQTGTGDDHGGGSGGHGSGSSSGSSGSGSGGSGGSGGDDNGS
jgi:uncharacterized membrane protein YgcG